jgi:tRNA(Ile)-lysidine synthase
MNLSNILYPNFEVDPWFNPKKKILLALSGGQDSMVLFDICVQLKLNFTAAYVNYGLRPDENKKEIELIQLSCQKHKITYLIKEVSAEDTYQLQAGNLQEKARIIRYQWFEQLRLEHSFDFLFTAHHAQDQAETIIFNLSRGTGLNGLGGMRLQNDWHIRPLLFTNKNQIERYASLNDIHYCQDSSNHSFKYTRNKIRHQLVQPLETIFPHAVDQIAKTAIRLQDTDALLNELVQHFIENNCQLVGNSIVIPTNLLLNFRQHSLMLYQIINKYGFNGVQTENIIQAIHQKHEGAFIATEQYQLVYSRQALYLFEKLPIEPPLNFNKFENNVVYHGVEIELSILHKKDIINLKDGSLYLDASKVTLPLTLRLIQQGDRIKPFGSKGSKLVSDYVQEKKLNPIQKSQLLALVSETEIAAILPLCIHQKLAVEEQTSQVLKIIQKER